MTQPEETGWNHKARERACQYMLLSRLFSDQIVTTDIEDFLTYLEPLAQEQYTPAAEFFRRLKQWLQGENLDQQLKTEYVRLFVMPGGIKPYESVYLGESPLLMQEPWVKVKQFYKQCGLKLDNPARLPEDHVSVELSFMLHLIETNSGDMAKHFYEKHLGCWALKMLDDLSQHRHANFFTSVADFGRGFLESEGAFFLGGTNPARTLQGREKSDE